MADVIAYGDVSILYDQYKNQNADIESAKIISDRVNSFLDVITFGRISGELSGDTQDKVLLCANEMAAFLVEERFDPELASESVGDWSRTLAHASKNTEEQRMYQIACRWLAGTGLLYCGV